MAFFVFYYYELHHQIWESTAWCRCEVVIKFLLVNPTL